MPDSIENTRRVRRTNTDRVATRATSSKTSAEGPAGSSESDFRAVLANKCTGAAERKLEVILGEIRELASVLQKKRLLEDLENYRRKVGEFIKVFIDEVLDVRETASRTGLSRRRQMIIVRKVDVELEELSRLILGNSPDFRIVKELAIIEGLLMDLYR